MLSAFRNAFKIPELRGKILFTVAIIAVYRLGSHLPVPGVDFDAVQDYLRNPAAQDPNGAFTLINLFSGGALTQFAIFALGIMPYISSSGWSSPGWSSSRRRVSPGARRSSSTPGT